MQRLSISSGSSDIWSGASAICALHPVEKEEAAGAGSQGSGGGSGGDYGRPSRSGAPYGRPGDLRAEGGIKLVNSVKAGDRFIFFRSVSTPRSNRKRSYDRVTRAQREEPQNLRSSHEGLEDPLDLDQILGRTWDRDGSFSSSQDPSQPSSDEEQDSQSPRVEMMSEEEEQPYYE